MTGEQLHVDLVKKEWLAGLQIVVARIDDDSGRLRMDSDEYERREHLLHQPQVDRANRETIDPEAQPDAPSDRLRRTPPRMSDGAVAIVRFVPDCAVLFARLLRDPRVPRRRKALLALLAGYLALPFDLVPDFLPVIGQLDDALLVVLVLRAFVRAGDDELLREHWPGPEGSLRVVLRAASF